MSHWKKFESDVLKNTKTDLLRKALAELGLELDTNIKSIKNSWGTDSVDMGLRKDGRQVALGFKEIETPEGKKLELTGDFYGTGINEYDFMDKLSQHYQKENIVSTLEEQGWMVEEIKVNKNGEFEIEASQWQ